MQIRNINWPEDQDRIAEHIRLVHAPGDSDFLMQWYGNFPGFDPANCFVIDGAQGEIAAHIMLVPRPMRIGPAVIPASEIAVVGTLDTYRGQGYAGLLMERALERMDERGDVLSLILGIPNFYERWDYEYAVGLYLTSYESEISTELALAAGRWNTKHSYQRRTAAYLGTHGRDVEVRRFYSNDLPAVMALYDQEAAQGRYMIDRDVFTWEWQLRFLEDIGRYDMDDFLVAEVDNQLLGYVRVISTGQVNWFRENEAARFSIIESAGTDPDAAEALLGAVAQYAADYDADRIGMFIHPASQLMKHVIARGGVRRDFTGAAFLRLHDLPALFDLLKPTFAQRLAQSPFVGRNFTLYVTTGDNQTELIFGTGGEEVSMEVPSTDLLRLVTGWFTIDDIPADYTREHQRDLLRVLFPKREPRLGMADIL